MNYLTLDKALCIIRRAFEDDLQEYFMSFPPEVIEGDNVDIFIPPQLKQRSEFVKTLETVLENMEKNDDSTAQLPKSFKELVLLEVKMATEREEA